MRCLGKVLLVLLPVWLNALPTNEPKVATLATGMPPKILLPKSVFQQQSLAPPEPTATNSASTPTISVCIPAIPRDVKVTKRLLQSIKAQTVQPHEVIVAISETSTDEGVRLEEQFREQWPGTIVLATTEKKMAMENRIRAAAKATGAYVSFMDADDEMHPQKIEVMAGVVQENDAAVVLHSYVFEKSKAHNLRFDWHKAIIDRGAAIAQQTADNDRNVGHPPGADGKLAIYPRGLIVKGKNLGPHHGHPTVRRDVALRVPNIPDARGQDSLFLRHVFAMLGNQDSTMLYVDLPLTYYYPSDHPDNEVFKDWRATSNIQSELGIPEDKGQEWVYDPAPIVAVLP